MLHTLFAVVILSVVATAYIPHGKEQFFTDAMLREVVDRMGRDLAAAADSYLDSSDSSDGAPSFLSNRAMKILENDDSGYPLDLEGLEPPSLRDQEFLQHSSLWGSQLINGDAGEGPRRLKPNGIMNQQLMKTDPSLPAYCNPPNPCPVGYSLEDGCLEEFENTAAFSRKFQADQVCMCDTEHMFDCPVRDYDPELDMNTIMNEINVSNQHKNLVAKKFHSKKASNPYLAGEKLPIAAKKGLQLKQR